MENTKVGAKKSHRRPKALATVLATVSLAGGVLLPAAAAPSASAATMQCYALRSVWNVYFLAGIKPTEKMKSTWVSKCMGKAEVF